MDSREHPDICGHMVVSGNRGGAADGALRSLAFQTPNSAAIIVPIHASKRKVATVNGC